MCLLTIVMALIEHCLHLTTPVKTEQLLTGHLATAIQQATLPVVQEHRVEVILPTPIQAQAITQLN